MFSVIQLNLCLLLLGLRYLPSHRHFVHLLRIHICRFALILTELFGRWNDHLTSRSLLERVFQVGILKFEQLDFSPLVEYDLLLGIHLNNWFVLNVHSATGVVERAEGLFDVD